MSKLASAFNKLRDHFRAWKLLSAWKQEFTQDGYPGTLKYVIEHDHEFVIPVESQQGYWNPDGEWKYSDTMGQNVTVRVVKLACACGEEIDR